MASAAQATEVTIDANNAGTWNQWIDTGVDVAGGSTLSVSATGSATTNGFEFHGPDGKPSPQSPSAESLVTTVNVGSLVGMIDDPPGSIPSAPPFDTTGMYLLDDGSGGPLFGPGFVGSSFSQTVPPATSGRLYLGFNDGFDADNSGSYAATISVSTPVPAAGRLGLAIVAVVFLCALFLARRKLA